MPNTIRRVVRATSILGTARVLVFALGFLKSVLAAYYFGTSRAMDIYLIALIVPEMAVSLAITGLFNFIPLFAAEKAAHGEEEAWRSAGRMISYWLLLIVVVLALCAALAPWLATLVAPGFQAGEMAETTREMRTLILMSVAVGASRVLAAALLARQRFLVASASDVVFQLASILYLVLLHRQGIQALVVGMVFAGFLQLAVTAGGLYWQGVRFEASLELGHPVVRRMLRMTLPVYIGASGSHLNSVIMRAFASTLAAGAVSALGYALFLVDRIADALGRSLAEALLPFLSHQATESDDGSMARSADRALVGACLLMTPASVGLLLLAHPVVRLLFERGSFDARSTELTAASLQVYAPAVLAISLGHVLSTVYFARHDTATPVKTGLWRVAITALGCLLLVPRLAHVGIALATSIGHFAKLALLFHALRRTAERPVVASALRSLLRIAGASAVMALVVYPLALKLDAPTPLGRALLALGGTVVLGAAVYAASLFLLAPAEFAYYSRFVPIPAALRGSGAGVPRRSAPTPGNPRHARR